MNELIEVIVTKANAYVRHVCRPRGLSDIIGQVYNSLLHIVEDI